MFFGGLYPSKYIYTRHCSYIYIHLFTVTLFFLSSFFFFFLSDSHCVFRCGTRRHGDVYFSASLKKSRGDKSAVIGKYMSGIKFWCKENYFLKFFDFDYLFLDIIFLKFLFLTKLFDKNFLVSFFFLQIFSGVYNQKKRNSFSTYLYRCFLSRRPSPRFSLVLTFFSSLLLFFFFSFSSSLLLPPFLSSLLSFPFLSFSKQVETNSCHHRL